MTIASDKKGDNETEKEDTDDNGERSREQIKHGSGKCCACGVLLDAGGTMMDNMRERSEPSGKVEQPNCWWGWGWKSMW
jgi:hypothetical protein